jgi:hypothetical protein
MNKKKGENACNFSLTRREVKDISDRSAEDIANT